MNKILKSAFVALIATMGLTMTSCVNEYDYDGANAVGEQVYFGADMGKVIETPKSASSFSVMVRRINTHGALTVPVTITQSEGSIYTPAAQEVTFADGADAAPLIFTYNPDDVVYGTYYDITCSLNDASLGSPYGETSYSFQAGATAWVDMDGKATYIEDFVGIFFGVEHVTYEVAIQRNTVEDGYYRLVNAYGKAYPYNAEDEYDTSKDYYLTVNATDPDYVYVDESPTGMDWGYGDFSFWSLPSYFLSKGYSIEEVKANYGAYFGKMKDGIITMPKGSLLISMADYQGGTYYQGGDGVFTIALPGYSIADLSAEITYSGIFTDAANQVFAVGNLTLGEDAKNVKAIVMPADADPNAVADAIAAGELEAIDVVAGAIQVPIPEDMTGKLQIIVVVLNDEGEVKTVATAPFEYYGGGGSPWTSLGVGYYTDDFVVPFYGDPSYPPYTYEVEIEESTETPGLYRIRNAYAPVAEAFGETGGEKDILIHAENPNGVYFLTQPIGIDFGKGEFSIVSYGGDDVEYFTEQYGVTPEQVIAAFPEDFGTLEDGVITLPYLTATDSEGNIRKDSNGDPIKFQGYLYRSDGGAWYSCRNGAFALVLPSANAAARAKAKRRAAAADFEYRLNGGASNCESKNHLTSSKKLRKFIKNAKPFKL